MRWARFLLVLAFLGGCVVEEKPVGDAGVGGTGGGDGGVPCEGCEGDTPACDLETGTCVECTPDDDARCTGGTPVCDPDDFRCVACLDDTTCTDPTEARCNTSTLECVPCNDNAQCDDVDGLPGNANACNADGRCVECTPASEASTCPGNVSCDPATETCTQTPLGSRLVCQTCLSDSECGDDDGVPSDDYRCVPMFWPDAETRFPDESTGFCLKTTTGGCEEPFSLPLAERETLSGQTGSDYCGIDETLATCLSVRALVDNVRCDGGSNEECPHPPSGLCERVGVLENRCTYRCRIQAEVSAECLKNMPEGRNGSSCGDGSTGGDDYCGG